MVRVAVTGTILITIIFWTLAPVASGLSDRTQEGETVEWRFLSPVAVPFDEGIQVTCLTHVDLRENPFAADDLLNEHIQFSCISPQGTYCDYPSWTPTPIQNPDLCSDASEIGQCEGILYDFTGILRITPKADGEFLVTYDGTYGIWEGNC